MSAWHKNPRWPGLRQAAKRRDGWACVRCGSRHRLEVDHIETVERRPDRALALDNLQTLCRTCHLDKTRRESTERIDPDRIAWREAVSALSSRRS